MENMPLPSSIVHAKESAAQLKRIADALERIAAQLEPKLTPKTESLHDLVKRIAPPR